MREAKQSDSVDEVNDDTVSPPMDPNVEHWVQREIQLNQLHEEILAKREALLHTREDNAHKSGSPVKEETDHLRKVRERNQALVQDIATAQSKLTEDGRRPVSPRFATLQNNYWVMVKNVSQVWEEELLDFKQKQRVKQQQRSPGIQRKALQTSPKFQRGSPKNPRISPKLQRRSPQMQRSSPKVNRTSSDRYVDR